MIDLSSLLKKAPQLYSAARRVQHLLYGYPERELKLLPLLVDPARLAIDVGAHSGLYTAELLRLCSSVIAIEALPELARELETICPAARVINAAASSENGRTTLFVPTGKTGLSSIAKDNPIRVEECRQIEVDMITIDSIATDKVGFMKIDVEGNELAVLQGSEQMLRRDRPVLLIEAEERHRTNAVRSIEDQLKPLGYTGLMLENGQLRSLNSFDPVRDQNVSPSKLEALNRGTYKGLYINNFIFLP